jgi:hypothetical protein
MLKLGTNSNRYLETTIINRGTIRDDAAIENICEEM